MSSILRLLHPTAAAGPAPPVRKPDVAPPPPSPLEQLLAADISPAREDGGDKFFGFENVSAHLSRPLEQS